MERQWQYQIRNHDGGTSSYRTLSAPSLGAVLDKALSLFIKTWKRPPDKIDIEFKNTYSFKQN